MRKAVLRALVLVGVTALVGVGVAQAITLRIGNIVITADGGFTPTTLPKHKNAPIKLFGHARFGTTDGTRPSPLRNLTLEFDKHGAVETRGLEKCTMAKLVATTTKVARKLCPNAIVVSLSATPAAGTSGGASTGASMLGAVPASLPGGMASGMSLLLCPHAISSTAANILRKLSCANPCTRICPPGGCPFPCRRSACAAAASPLAQGRAKG